jgi:hypothetical protein
MVKTSTTSFRLDEPFLQLLEGLAAENGLSKTELVRESVTNHNRLLAEGFRNLLADVAALRERYGDNPELLCMVEMGSDGTPVGKVVIDMKHVEDVVAHPLADTDAGLAYVFLEVTRERREAPTLLRVGKTGPQWLFLPEQPKIPIGALPWPPRKDKIRLRLGELAEVLSENPQQVEPVSV